MQRAEAVLGLLVLVGICLLGYGLLVGNEAVYFLSVEDPASEDETERDVQVLEYDYLEPRTQDAFRAGIQSGEFVKVSRPPRFRVAYVHYRGDRYLTSVAHGDASQTTMTLSIAGGIVLIALGTVGLHRSS